MSVPSCRPDGVAAGPMLEALQQRPVNYSRNAVNAADWHHDTWTTTLPSERPGPPEPGGVWYAACRLVERYEFSDPRLVRAVYRVDSPLLGRTMLLEARFLMLRFYVGVRITEVVDELRPSTTSETGMRAWGWAYETLTGHLERGRLCYEVIKEQDTGRILFTLTAHSQRAPTLGWVTRLGWWLFGRRTQLRFYRRCGQRLTRALETHGTHAYRSRPAADDQGLVVAPSDARRGRLDRFGVRRVEPG